MKQREKKEIGEAIEDLNNQLAYSTPIMKFFHCFWQLQKVHQVPDIYTKATSLL